MKISAGPELVDPRTAVGAIPRSARIFIESTCGEPQTLVTALAESAESFDRAIVYTGLSSKLPDYVSVELRGNFRLHSFMSNICAREAMAEGIADYVPVTLSQVPRLLAQGRIRLDVALVQVSPPDHAGYCSLGVNVSYTRSAMAAARLVIAEVNEQMPRTKGDSLVHMSQLDYMVESSRPIREVASGSGGADPVLSAIAANVARLVPERATIQVGIGRFGDAVWEALSDRQDLGIHTGSVSDGVIDLVERGVVTNRHKTMFPGRIVTGQLIGTRRLYDFAHDNELFDLRSVGETHAPQVLARLDGLVSINSALQVDLRGQVNSDTLRGVQIAGGGGALDFASGATMAEGGISIVALPSTASGVHSRIVRSLDAGTATIPATLVDFVVTEHGIAELSGRSLAERREAMVEIAAPTFRPDLRAPA